jgi:hypothetical protein
VVRINPPTDPTIVDILMILNVKILISISYDFNINGAVLCAVINTRSAQFSNLNLSITAGNHQWRRADPLFKRRGLQTIPAGSNIGEYYQML